MTRCAAGDARAGDSQVPRRTACREGRDPGVVCPLPAQTHSALIVHIMLREHYEQSKRRLEEQRRTGVELVEAAYQAQVRALDLVWMLQGEGADSGFPGSGSLTTAPSQKEPVASVPPSPRRSAYEVEDGLRESLARLPETFNRNDVCRVLGYEPDRGVLYRALTKLVQEGVLRVESRGDGRRAAVYRQVGTASSPE
jgi:hypothetical protein